MLIFDGYWYSMINCIFLFIIRFSLIINLFTMVYRLLFLLVSLGFATTIAAQDKALQAQTTANTIIKSSTDGVQWLSWEEAQAKMKTEPRKIFIDMYTSWCGWCKKMDASTFKDPAVVKNLNENFYAVKFNAEQKETINYSGHDFQFVKNGRRGYHQLAHSLLNGRMSYPSFVYLNEKMERIMISPGFKQVNQILIEFDFAKEEKYSEMNFNEYKKSRA